VSAFALGALAAALLFDEALGEPPAAVHPVVWMGRVVALGERLSPARGRLAQLLAGGAMAVGIPAAFAGAAWALDRWLRTFGLVGAIVCGVALKPTFALRALGAEARGVRDAVARGDIQAGRARLRALCSRDASALDGEALVAATVESVAENASDSFVAPLFWFALFGLAGAVFYRAVNTLDAMIGYHGRYEWLGKASARLDDALNWIPARATAALLLVSGAAVGRGAAASETVRRWAAAGETVRLDVRRGARILRRDASRTESPNAGRPMAAMAGLLGVELAKAGHYRLGDAVHPLEPHTIDRAWRAVRGVALLAAVACGIACGSEP
jgi:adenosylcobinamide-phosphate synthase